MREPSCKEKKNAQPYRKQSVYLTLLQEAILQKPQGI